MGLGDPLHHQVRFGMVRSSFFEFPVGMRPASREVDALADSKTPTWRIPTISTGLCSLITSHSARSFDGLAPLRNRGAVAARVPGPAAADERDAELPAPESCKGAIACRAPRSRPSRNLTALRSDSRRCACSGARDGGVVEWFLP